MRALLLIPIVALAGCMAPQTDRDPMMEGRASAKMDWFAGPLFGEHLPAAKECIFRNATPGEVRAIAEAEDFDALDEAVKPVILRPATQQCARDYARAQS